MLIADASDSRIEKALLEHGSHSLAYSTVQDGMEYFINSAGYIAYNRCNRLGCRSTVVLGDPVSARENKPELLKQFTERFPDSVFWQISQDTAETLSKLGYYVNDLGLDTIVNLSEFEGTWKTHKSIRREARKAQRAGIVVAEQRIADVNSEELRAVNQSWLQSKSNNNPGQRFLTRPLVLSQERDVRYFFAYENERLIGYRFFDPLYHSGNVIGYYADITRVATSAPSGVSYLLALTAIRKFKDEGYTKLTLGFSPFARIEDSNEFKFSKFAHNMFRIMYSKWEKVYGFQGLHDHKNRFHGKHEKVYFASRSPVPVSGILAGYYLTGVDPFKQTLKGLFKL